jgi:hypothetical protein
MVAPPFVDRRFARNKTAHQTRGEILSPTLGGIGPSGPVSSSPRIPDMGNPADRGRRDRQLPVRSPKLNAYAERFVLSIKSECLSRIVPLGEGHLRLVVPEYTKHYHLERNHQGIGNRLMEGARGDPPTDGRVACGQRPGGCWDFTSGRPRRGRPGFRTLRGPVPRFRLRDATS